MQLQGKAQGEEGNGSKRAVKARSKGAFTPYCMRLCPASHKEGRRAGPHGGRIPRGLCSSGPANAMPVRHISPRCHPAPSPAACSQKCVTEMSSLMLTCSSSTAGSSSLSPGTNILPAKALTPMWLNHPRIRTQTSWRKSLPPPSPLLSKHTRSWPMKRPCRPLPVRHKLWLDLPLCRWAFQS